MSETMQPTMSLRWSAGGQLEQMFTVKDGTFRWILVPKEEPKGGFQLTAEPALNGAKRKSGDLFVDLLPNEWLSSLKFADAWRGFVEMRSIKYPLTERAVRLLVPKLRDIGQRFGTKGVLASLDASTLSQWRDIFDPKDMKSATAKPTANLQPDFTRFIETHPNEKWRKFKSLESLQPHESYVATAFHRWVKTQKHEV